MNPEPLNVPVSDFLLNFGMPITVHQFLPGETFTFFGRGIIVSPRAMRTLVLFLAAGGWPGGVRDSAAPDEDG